MARVIFGQGQLHRRQVLGLTKAVAVDKGANTSYSHYGMLNQFLLIYFRKALNGPPNYDGFYYTSYSGPYLPILDQLQISSVNLS